MNYKLKQGKSETEKVDYLKKRIVGKFNFVKSIEGLEGVEKVNNRLMASSKGKIELENNKFEMWKW